MCGGGVFIQIQVSWEGICVGEGSRAVNGARGGDGFASSPEALGKAAAVART